ncbi:MAG: DUF1573 domain-containing protein [Pirellulales bacterium]
MKARYVVIASGLAGLAAGVGMTWAAFADVPPLEIAKAARAPAAGKPPRLVVDTKVHNFGLIDRDSSVTHTFRITNVGGSTLTLKSGTTTCTACTIAALSKKELAPGETAEVIVEYSARQAKPQFEQYATVLTNDPEQPRLELKIQGGTIRKFQILPDRVVLSNASASEPTTSELKVLCFLSDKLRVVDLAFEVNETSGFFEAKSEAIPPGELPGEAKSGCRVLVTVKPGLPLGPFRQTIRLALESGDDSKRTETEVYVEGAVVSDLSIVGPGWRSDAAVLSLGNVARDKGAKRTLNVLVRGAARRDVRVEPIELDPPWLRVTLGEPAELNESVIKIPLTVEIPPGRPPAIYLGTDQGKFGKILLGVKNHPYAKEIKMHVSFVIGNGS